jgi:hypothetical protein
MRMRAFPAYTVAALAIGVALSTPVAARWVNPETSGYCAEGACNRFGGIRAANIKFCKPENCRDYMPVNLETVTPARSVSCPAVSATPMSWPSWPWSWFWPRRECGATNEK